MRKISKILSYSFLIIMMLPIKLFANDWISVTDLSGYLYNNSIRESEKVPIDTHRHQTSEYRVYYYFKIRSNESEASGTVMSLGYEEIDGKSVPIELGTIMCTKDNPIQEGYIMADWNELYPTTIHSLLGVKAKCTTGSFEEVVLRLERRTDYRIVSSIHVYSTEEAKSRTTVVTAQDIRDYDYYIHVQKAVYSSYADLLIEIINDKGQQIYVDTIAPETLEASDPERTYMKKIDVRNCKELTLRLNTNTGHMQAVLYKKKKPLNLKISTPYKFIGDNTCIDIDVVCLGNNNTFIQLYNKNTKSVISSYSAVECPNKIKLNLNEGLYLIGSKIVDINGNNLFEGNSIEIDKNNILNKVFENIGVNNLQNIIIINETDRYFEDNQINRDLVQQIKEKSDGIYFIYNDVSPVLEPLLEN